MDPAILVLLVADNGGEKRMTSAVIGYGEMIHAPNLFMYPSQLIYQNPRREQPPYAIRLESRFEDWYPKSQYPRYTV